MALAKVKHSTVFNNGVSLYHGQIIDVEEKDLLKRLVDDGTVEAIEDVNHLKLTKQMIGE